jgi:gliding motility-associated-like protein
LNDSLKYLLFIAYLTGQKLSTILKTFIKFSTLLLVFIFNLSNSFAQVNADFFADITQACKSDSVKFINTSTGDYNWIEWDFNDDGVPDLFGNPTVDTSLVSPTYIYEESGLYSVKLMIKNDIKSDSLTRTDYITVNNNPNAAFILNNTGGCAPLLVQGINQSTPGDTGIDSLNWILTGPDSGVFFGDTVNIPIAMPLDYFVYLTVVDSFGCSSTDSMLVPIININPHLDTVYSACNESTFTIINNTTGDNPPFKYEWIFDTGDTLNFSDTSETTNPSIFISGIESDSIFSNSVTITDTTGCSFTWIFDISVTVPLLTYSDTAGVLTCDPLFSIDYLFPISSMSTNIDTFIVDFGDGTSDGTTDSVVADLGLSHTYITVGAFDVTYSVIDTNGCITKAAEDSLVWVQGPEVTPVWEILDPCPMKVQFNLVDTSGVDSVLWFFGDEVESTEFNPGHTYEEVKNYQVKVWAYGDVDINNGEQHSTGCAIEYTTTVIVDVPFIFFTFENDTDSLCEGEDVEIKNQSINNTLFVIENWIWDFGDQSSLTQPGPVPINPVIHLYNIGKTENYTITLTATTVGGCIAPEFSSNELYVMPPLDLKPAISKSEGCVPLSIIFDPDNSGLRGQISNPFWDFDDNNTSGALIAQHTYEVDGMMYNVTLDYSAGACLFENMDMGVITTFPDPLAEMSYTPVTENNSVVSFNMVNESTGADRVEWWIDGVLVSTANQINIPVGEDYQLLVLKAFSNKDCVAETELNLKGVLVNPVNIITPNGDGFNDVLKFDIPEKQECLILLVYDRWGRKVYESNSYADDWGGTDKNGGELKEGTYFYSLDVCSDFVVTGYLTIVR